MRHLILLHLTPQCGVWCRRWEGCWATGASRGVGGALQLRRAPAPRPVAGERVAASAAVPAAAAVAAADPTLPAARAAAAVDAVATTRRRPVAGRSAGRRPDALTVGAPPAVGRLVAELRAAGSTLPEPACGRCGRTGKPLTRSDAAGCAPAAGAANSPPPAPAAGWSNRSPAATSSAGRSAPAAPTGRNGPADGADGPGGSPARATGGQPDICDGCFRAPPRRSAAAADGAGRARSRPGPNPDLRQAAHRARPRPARTAAQRPPTDRPLARGTGLRPLLHRGAAPPRHLHRLRDRAAPGRPARPGRHHLRRLRRRCRYRHACTDCGIEDKLYERGRCAPLRAAPPHRRAALRRRRAASRPSWHRSTKRSPPPTPHAPR